MSLRNDSGDSFEDEVAVIVGASRGLGAAVAETLLARGASVVAVARRETRLAELADQLGQPEALLTFSGDVLDMSLGERVCDAALQRFGRIDLLVNCAALSPIATPLQDTELAAFESILKANVLGPWRFATAAMSRGMQDGGAIVNVGTVGGLEPVPNFGPYNVSKAGLHHLTRQMALEYAPRVRVNAVAPGMFKSSFSGPLLRSRPESAAANLLRRAGLPEDDGRRHPCSCSPPPRSGSPVRYGRSTAGARPRAAGII